jgi:saccharopine dehydrogenase-like NADP-dependent oxidoreductase
MRTQYKDGGHMRIVVLGGGAQGRVIAADLAAARPDSRIEVADLREPDLRPSSNLAWRMADLSGGPEAIARVVSEYDLAVGALPSRFGYSAMQGAIAARRPLVDVSFCPEDALTLDAEARAAGVPILVDCGLAPGISNLVLGRLVAAHGTPEEIMIYVGGVAQDKDSPYGYVITWSIDDLLEEYTRPARIVRDGRPVTVPVFSGMERVDIDGVGEMEAFYSDGLRSLIDTLPGVREMGEKTLRWPGHVEAVKPLIESDRLIEELRARCVADHPRDLVAFLVRARWDRRSMEVMLVDRADSSTGRTAMSRTTALTTSACAQLVAAGGVQKTGVLPLERVSDDEKAFEFVVERFSRHGIRLRVPELGGVA